MKFVAAFPFSKFVAALLFQETQLLLLTKIPDAAWRACILKLAHQPIGLIGCFGERLLYNTHCTTHDIPIWLVGWWVTCMTLCNSHKNSPLFLYTFHNIVIFLSIGCFPSSWLAYIIQQYIEKINPSAITSNVLEERLTGICQCDIMWWEKSFEKGLVFCACLPYNIPATEGNGSRVVDWLQALRIAQIKLNSY